MGGDFEEDGEDAYVDEDFDVFAALIDDDDPDGQIADWEEERRRAWAEHDAQVRRAQFRVIQGGRG